ncbi:MAG: polysaccharide biosynthesis tyrosine autokinase [Anaerolineales bacterium]|nr:polysaccharide biosynthesis tyrosine autokinase [Anaerolineales bacterium]
MENQTTNYYPDYAENQIDLRRYLAIAWRWAWLLMLVSLIAGMAAFAVGAFVITPVYQATTTLLINQASARESDYNAILSSERLARTYAELIEKQPVMDEVITRLSLDATSVELKGIVEVKLVQNTQLIEVYVENTDPVLAAQIANTIIDVFIEQNQSLQASRFAASKESLAAQLDEQRRLIDDTMLALENLSSQDGDQVERDRLDTNLAQFRQTYANLLQSYESVRVAEAQATSNVVQVEPAAVPETPVRPRVFLNTILAAILGLMLGIGVVILIEALDRSIRNPTETSRQLGLPVLGVISAHETEAGQPVTAVQPRSPVSEAFRSLRTNIQFASVDYSLRTVLVTSPSPSEGKSTIAANLAVVLAQSGMQVVLIDADMRKPTVHKQLNLSNRTGLSTLFVQPEILLDGSLQETATKDLYAISSGSLPPNPAELLGSEKMFSILERVKSIASTVVIDAPPILAVTDASILAARVDGVVVVVQPGKTSIDTAQQTVEQLRRIGANVIGMVFNKVDVGRSRYGYYQNDYHYAYHSTYSEPATKRNGLFKRKQKSS